VTMSLRRQLGGRSPGERRWVSPMGEVVAAAVVAHQPLIMLPRELRIRLGQTGRDTTLIEPGFRLLRQHLDERGVDTLVIVDTHWFTTSQHVVAGAERYAGRYTSEEMPEVIADLPYDFAGAPALAEHVAEAARARGLPVVNATTDSLPRHYPTINLVHHLVRPPERVLSVGVLQTAGPPHFLAFGEAIAEGVARSDHRVAVLGSGGMSHTFWPIDEQRGRSALDPRHVISDEAREWDTRILAHWAAGEHDRVVDLYPEYRSVHPEGLFGHYLTLLGAIGGRACRAPGRQLSEYENAMGTGQVHVVFDLTAATEPAGTEVAS
jgi:3,4-dihydroxyphenylacetate 2,3-dioxygenase